MITPIKYATILLTLTVAGWAQQTPAEFEVASVRPNTGNDRIVTIDSTPEGNFHARGYSLKLLIQRAYGVKGFQISGGPKWLDEDRFDVVAKAFATGAERVVTPAQMRTMLQALLADRFRLRAHKVSKELPGLALTVAGGGPRLQKSKITDEGSDPIHRNGVFLVAEGVSMKTFAETISSYLAKPVANETALPGLYDFQVEWVDQGRLGATGVDATGTGQSQEQTGLSMFSALQEQLGLKLVSRSKVPVETLVIDSAEKASPN